MKTSCEICFVCGSKGASNVLFVRPHDEGLPYFSFLESHVAPRGAHRPTVSGGISACTVCYAFLNQQWDAYERTRTPLVKRLYWLKRVDNGTFTGAEMSIQGEYMAQLMGLHGIGIAPNAASLFGSGSQAGIACGDAPSPASHDGNESVLSDYANGALDLSISPKKSLLKGKKQKSLEAPRSRRNGTKGTNRNKTASENVVCYVCGVVCSPSSTCFIYAIKYQSDEPFFPFLLSLPAPPGALPMTKTGLTQVCAECRKTLSRQWRAFESRGVCEKDRAYRVGSSRTVVNPPAITNNNNLPEGRNAIGSNNGAVCYICAEPHAGSRIKIIATRSNSGAMLTLPFVAHMKCPLGAFPIGSDGLVRICVLCYDHLDNQRQLFEEQCVPVARRNYTLRPCIKSVDMSQSSIKVNTKSEILAGLEQTQVINGYPRQLIGHDKNGVAPSQCNTYDDLNRSDIEPKDKEVKFCYVCDVQFVQPLAKNGVSHTLQVLPADDSMGDSNGDSKAKLSIPFFPFLKQLKPAQSSSLSNTVNVCAVCYCLLVRQWDRYERSADLQDQDRWHRSYQYRTIECDSCQKQVHRTEISLVSCNSNLGKNHMFENDDFSLVCMSCKSSISVKNLVKEKSSAHAGCFSDTRSQSRSSSRDTAAEDICTGATTRTAECFSVDTVDGNITSASDYRWLRDNAAAAAAAAAADGTLVNHAKRSSPLRISNATPVSRDLLTGTCDSFSSSALTMLERSLVQSDPQHILPLMSLYYPALHFPPRASPLRQAASSLAMLMPSTHSALFSSGISPSNVFNTSLRPGNTSSVQQSDAKMDTETKIQRLETFSSVRHSPNDVCESTKVVNVCSSSRPSEPSPQVLCSKPVFHRPFLDGPISTPTVSANAIEKASVSSGIVSGNTEPHHKPSQGIRGDVAIDKGVPAEERRLSEPLQTASPDKGGVAVDIHANDGRLSAALGLICLSSVTEPSRSSTESSLASLLPADSINVKRPRLDSMSDIPRVLSSADEDETRNLPLQTRCAWDSECIIGRRLTGGGYNNMSFSWPGVGPVIEAYMQHLQEDRTERCVLVGQQKHLKDVNQLLSKSAKELEMKLEEAKSVQSALASQRVQLQEAITNLKKLSFSVGFC